MKPTLELPVTLRYPNPDEIPTDSELKQRLVKRMNANIVEGYRLFPKDNNPDHSNLAFNFFAEINIDNSNLWNLIISLCNELPEEVSLIFNESDLEPNYGNYSDKDETLSILNSFKEEITKDPFIDIGLIFHSESELIEIFVPESKYIKFWGVNEKSFREIMDRFNLKEIPDLEFVDEYPKVREALRLHSSNVIEPFDLINTMKEKFL